MITDTRKILITKDKKEMAEVVKAMNTIIKAINDEYGYYSDWIQIVPDEADEDDFNFIATDTELLDDTIKIFKEIINYCM